ncbi:uncharacterized protein LOC144381367 [Halichoerus grypus]
MGITPFSVYEKTLCRILLEYLENFPGYWFVFSSTAEFKMSTASPQSKCYEQCSRSSASRSSSYYQEVSFYMARKMDACSHRFRSSQWLHLTHSEGNQLPCCEDTQAISHSDPSGKVLRPPTNYYDLIVSSL